MKWFLYLWGGVARTNVVMEYCFRVIHFSPRSTKYAKCIKIWNWHVERLSSSVLTIIHPKLYFLRNVMCLLLPSQNHRMIKFPHANLRKVRGQLINMVWWICNVTICYPGWEGNIEISPFISTEIEQGGCIQCKEYTYFFQENKKLRANVN